MQCHYSIYETASIKRGHKASTTSRAANAYSSTLASLLRGNTPHRLRAGRNCLAGFSLHRTIPIARSRVFLVAICGLAIWDVAHPAFGQGDDEYIYCRGNVESSNSVGRWYYTAVFKGDYSDTLPYINDFWDFLKDNEPETMFGVPLCFFERTRDEAEAELRYNQK